MRNEEPAAALTFRSIELPVLMLVAVAKPSMPAGGDVARVGTFQVSPREAVLERRPRLPEEQAREPRRHLRRQELGDSTPPVTDLTA